MNSNDAPARAEDPRMSGMLADAVSNAMDLRGVVLLGSKHCGDVATVDGYVTDLTIDLMP